MPGAVVAARAALHRPGSIVAMSPIPSRPELPALVDQLASPDPHVRDDGAYPGLASLIAANELDTADRLWLGDQMVERLGHPQPYARSFAPLVLALLADSWDLDAAVWPQRWTDALLEWWPREPDLRGWDPDLGWIHAVAQGADAVGTIGARGFAAHDLLLPAIAGRVTTSTDVVWRDQEEDRVTAAILAVLGAMDDPSLDALLDPIQDLFATGAPGPVPAPASNAMRTLRSLYIALAHWIPDDDGSGTHRIRNAERLQRDVAVTLQPVTAWLWGFAPRVS